MKIINTKLHGILDYITSFILILPWIVNYFPTEKDTWVLGAIGGVIFMYSFITDYEFGLIKVINMKTHLVLDIVIALLLIMSPKIWDFEHYSNWPVIVGFTGLFIAILSSWHSYRVTNRDLDISKH